MKHFLAYHQHYWVDVLHPANVKNGWGNTSPNLYNQVSVGDIIWVVARGGPGHEDEWRLLQKVVVQRKYYDEERSDKFRYRFPGDPDRSCVYDPAGQRNMESLMLKLEFASGKRITLRGAQIGLAIQGVRQLSRQDGMLLENYAATLHPYRSDSSTRVPVPAVRKD